ncbi:CPBP family intramembrane glutamic endopeptidase [Bacillus sp. FJAT-27245]|uniref:CPBP family intramembrane glutamic endopeptidase n=1 Tax=Bacillus sp. FJAT-27245 TaxID=1684144 RepID=UPI0006A7698D|nr:type II CAAX endopeptidase family protein [Bacillus sp. FJAT-27245]
MRWGKILIHCIGLVSIFLAAAIFVNPLTDGIANGTIRIIVKESLRLLMTVCLFSLYTKKVLKKTNASFGIRRPFKADKAWILLGVGMPLTVIVFYLLSHYAEFVIQAELSIKTVLALLVGSFIVSCSAGIIEEILFRGYLFKLIEGKWGAAAAITATSVLFGALHLLTAGSLQLLDALLILAAGTLAGILFSLIMQKTGNLWNAAAVHILWNFILNPRVVGFTNGANETGVSLINARFETDHIFVTGGAFGIEAGLPSMILYSIVILCLIVRHKNGKNHLSTKIKIGEKGSPH